MRPITTFRKVGQLVVSEQSKLGSVLKTSQRSGTCLTSFTNRRSLRTGRRRCAISQCWHCHHLHMGPEAELGLFFIHYFVVPFLGINNIGNTFLRSQCISQWLSLGESHESILKCSKLYECFVCKSRCQHNKTLVGSAIITPVRPETMTVGSRHKEFSWIPVCHLCEKTFIRTCIGPVYSHHTILYRTLNNWRVEILVSYKGAMISHSLYLSLRQYYQILLVTALLNLTGVKTTRWTLYLFRNKVATLHHVQSCRVYVCFILKSIQLCRL